MRALTILLALCGVAHAVPDEMARVYGLLESSRLDEAAPLVDRLRRDASVYPFAAGAWAYYHGDYAAAADTLETALAAGVLDPQLVGEARQMRDLARNNAAVIKGFVHRRSAHFDLAVAPGLDETLLGPALDTLERQWTEAGGDLGEQPAGPIRVEIYGDITDLAKVSPLTVAEIETSGTIALCKYNRLMATSPRALVAGYPWLDTLSHELTHYLVTRASHDTVPIWLHEGIAKMEETRWRSPFGGTLAPSQEHLLATGLRDGHLITFAQMHPSMALLPSQEDAGLAFAEVTTALQRITEGRGAAALRKLIGALRDGADVSHAVLAVTGETLPAFEKSWRAWLKTRGYKLHPELGMARLRFQRDGKQANAEEDEDAALDKKPGSERDQRARGHVRLGTMLRTRGRLQAAAMEYEQASAIFGAGHPEVAGRLGRTYLELHAWDKAIASARPGIERRPESAGLKATVGRALLEKGDDAAARPYLEGALAVNPYDPQTRCGLQKIYAALHDAREAVEADACKRVSAR